MLLWPPGNLLGGLLWRRCATRLQHLATACADDHSWMDFAYVTLDCSSQHRSTVRCLVTSCSKLDAACYEPRVRLPLLLCFLARFVFAAAACLAVCRAEPGSSAVRTPYLGACVRGSSGSTRSAENAALTTCNPLVKEETTLLNILRSRALCDGQDGCPRSQSASLVGASRRRERSRQAGIHTWQPPSTRLQWLIALKSRSFGTSILIGLRRGSHVATSGRPSS